MPRGLGPLQTEILQCLTLSRMRHIQKELSYRGKTWYGDAERVVSAFGFDVVMAEGVYDLRAVLRVVARRHGKIRSVINSDYPHVDPTLQTGFSKAVRGLVRRDILIPLLALPYEEVLQDREARRREELWRHLPQDRAIVVTNRIPNADRLGILAISPMSKQTRFVRLADSGKPERDAELAYYDGDIITAPRQRTA